MNTSPALIDYPNDLPVKTVEGAVIHVRDVAHVRDGNDPQQNIVRQDGLRSTLITVLKNGTASTLDVADGVKRAMAAPLKTLISEDVTVKKLIAQSLFVRALPQSWPSASRDCDDHLRTNPGVAVPVG